MTWLAQVLHVARKDVRMARWSLLAYVAVVGVATGILLTAKMPEIDGLTVALVALGMFVLAVLVQADSPARTDAFWVTRPLQPSAVFAAKLLSALAAVIGVGLVGQSIGLWRHDVAVPHYPALLARSAVTYGAWLVTAAVLASLTRDIRSFVVSLIAFLAGSIMISSVLEARYVARFADEQTMLSQMFGPNPAGRDAPSSYTIGLLVIAMLLLVAHQYLTRHVKRGVALAIILFIAAFAAVPAVTTALPQHEQVPTELKAELAVTSVEIERLVSGEGAYARVKLDVRGGSEHHKYTLDPAATLVRRDGSIDTVDVGSHATWLRSPPIGGSNPRRITVDANTWRDFVGVKLTRGQAEELRSGETDLVIRGRVNVRQSTDLGALRLRGRRGVALNGHRARVANARFSQEGPIITVAISWIPRSASRRSATRLWGYPSEDEYQYALVNDERNEAFALFESGRRGGASVLVLPGPDTRSTNVQLQAAWAHAERNRMSHDEAWMNKSSVHVVHWTLVGSYPIEVAVRTNE